MALHGFAGATGPMPWWTANLKLQAAEVDGNVAMKQPHATTRSGGARASSWPADWSGYTVEADVRSTESRPAAQPTSA
ncbi:MAG: hypothetical protein R2752_09045 [Vicinamibacterales bacterium]